MGCGMSTTVVLTPFQARLLKRKLENKNWVDYDSKLLNNYKDTKDFSKKHIVLNDKKMDYDFIIKGTDAPIMGYPLYICLHDGEVGRTAYNTSEYNKMKSYYAQSIDVGICLATRGIGDLSNMHYIDESYLFYEELIRKMINTENVDPNKVYLLGIGLGGNAVYQIATRISDRFAAISINSGHSFGTNVKNLFNIPTQIQVGENDFLFDRNQDAAKTYQRLILFNKERQMNTANAFECNIHCNRKNVIKDNHPKAEFQPVKNDPIAWMKGDVNSELRNTNAISFLKKFTRNPYPKRLVWDLTKISNYYLVDSGERKEIFNDQRDNQNPLDRKETITTKKESISDKNGIMFGKQKTISDMTYNDENQTEIAKEQREQRLRIALLNRNTISLLNINQHYYWLEIGNKTLHDIGVVEVIVQFDKNTNTITIESPVKYLRILLNEEIVDFEQEVIINYLGTRKGVYVSSNSKTEKRIVRERGDYTYLFQAALLIESRDLTHFKITPFEASEGDN